MGKGGRPEAARIDRCRARARGRDRAGRLSVWVGVGVGVGALWVRRGAPSAEALAHNRWNLDSAAFARASASASPPAHPDRHHLLSLNVPPSPCSILSSAASLAMNAASWAELLSYGGSDTNILSMLWMRSSGSSSKFVSMPVM